MSKKYLCYCFWCCFFHLLTISCAHLLLTWFLLTNLLLTSLLTFLLPLLIPPARLSPVYTSCLPAPYSPIHCSLTYSLSSCRIAYSTCSSFSCVHLLLTCPLLTNPLITSLLTFLLLDCLFYLLFFLLLT